MLPFRSSFLALVISMTLAACGGSSPLKKSLQEIKDNYQVDGLFMPPREKVSLGTVFRERDKLPLETKCFKGVTEKGAILSLTQNTGTYTNKASFLADWASIIGLDIDFKRVTEVKVKFGDFTETYLDKVRPDFENDCPASVHLGEAKLFAGLISTDKIEIEFKEKKDTKVNLSVSKLKQLANVDLKTGIEINSNKNLEFSGKKLFVAYREYDYKFEALDKAETCAVGKPCGKLADYDVTLQSIQTSPEGATATVRVVRLDFVPHLNEVKTLAAGDVVLLKKLSKQHHYLGVRVIDPAENEAEVYISLRKWSLQNGPRVMLKPES